MSNKDIILDSFARLVTNVRENRTFIHNSTRTRKLSRRARHSQPPPLSQQLFALQRHYLELCSTIAFTPSSTPGNSSPSPSSPRMWNEKRTPVAAPLSTASCAQSVAAPEAGASPPVDGGCGCGEPKERRGTSSPLLNGMRWDAANKQWIGNYTDADRFHKFGTIKPDDVEENDSLISKIADEADMWYDAKEFRWKKRKKKGKPLQKTVTSSVTQSLTSGMTSSPRARAKLTPRNVAMSAAAAAAAGSAGMTAVTSSLTSAATANNGNAGIEDDGAEEEDVFAGISIDVNPVEGDFTKGCFVLPEEVCDVIRDAGRRNDEELASWPGKVDVLTQRYSNANIIRRMAIKKVLHDITLASVKASSIMSPPNILPSYQSQHTHMASSISISSTGAHSTTTTTSAGGVNASQRQSQLISASPTSPTSPATTSLPSGGGASNGESPPLHCANIYGSHSALPPSLGTTPTPPPTLSITPKAATTPHRLVLSVRGTKSITAPKSTSSSAGAGSGSSSNAGSKRNSLVIQKFSPESDGDDSDPFADFEDDEEEDEEDTDTTTSSDDGSGFKFRLRRGPGNGNRNDNGSANDNGIGGSAAVSIGGKTKEGSVGVGSVESRAVPLRPKGIRIKSLPLNGGGNDDGGDFGMDDNENDGGSGSGNINSSNSSGCGSGGLCLKLRKFDGNVTDLDQLTDFDESEDGDGAFDVVVDTNDELDDDFMDADDDISDMVDNKTRSSSCTRSRSTSVKRGAKGGSLVKPLKIGGLKLSLRKFSPVEERGNIDPFAEFSDDGNGGNNTNSTSSNTTSPGGDDSDWDMADREEPARTTTTTSGMSTSTSGSAKKMDSPLNIAITPREKVKPHHSHRHRHHSKSTDNNSSGGDGDGEERSSSKGKGKGRSRDKSRSRDRDDDWDGDRGREKGKEPRHRKNTHHFATIRQDGTIVMDDVDGAEEVYDPYAGFDDSVIVGYEDVLKNHPSECYDDFIDMDDDTDLVLKCRNGGGEFSDEENDEDISGLDLSNVDQLVIHKNMN